MSLKWDGIDRLYITLAPSYMNKVRGLCGTFDANQNNDFITPAGDIETNKIAFTNKFVVDPGCYEPETTVSLPPCSLNSHMANFAEAKCAILNADIFRACHGSVSPDLYYDICMYDVCGCDTAYTATCLCESIAGYAMECANEGIFVDWREHELVAKYCDVSCPGSQVYSNCGPTCGQSCRDLSLPCIETDYCVEGCNCPEGSVLDDDGNCISPSFCPCYYDDHVYSPGDEIEQSCRTCTCINGTFDCIGEECNETLICPNNLVFDVHATPCPITCDNLDHYRSCVASTRPGCICPTGYVLNEDVCVLPSECPCYHSGHSYQHGQSMQIDACNQCVCKGTMWDCTHKVCPAVCSAVGEGHYTTFDGRMYSFVGDCRYTMVQSTNDTFSVEVENVVCGSSGITCTRAIEINIGDYVTIFLVRGGEVTVNDVKVQLPKHYYSLQIEKSGFFYTITSNIGLRVLWDGGTRVYVEVQPHFGGQLSGLCGNFDGNQENDFTAWSGAVEQSADNFANTWKVSVGCPELYHEDVVHPCTVNGHREAWAHRRCNILMQSLFEPCHSIVDPSPYLENCIYDSCGCDIGGDCECLCTAISAYAMECSRSGVHVKWRSQDLCAIQCEYGFEYSACGPSCQETCQTIGDEKPEYCNGCVEGCHCPEGMVVQDGGCVPADECPCYHGNAEYTPGTILLIDCQNCTCVRGNLECFGESCNITCAETEFHCDNDLCIPHGWTCDGDDDCTDGSDEKDCVYTCIADQYTCDSGHCIDARYYCDGSPDCEDNSDEADCPLPSCYGGEFQCDNGKCISREFVCDGEMDCGFNDAADEINCSKF
ncbi:SCO-spondin-like [Asterias rubens]|uniref:SCO-spondin-like n=1 Tax=Asterias rubens TaxID=7604 RepID=UPI00145525BB|nr:SCO-spondin-like [Asterias rubens]